MNITNVPGRYELTVICIAQENGRALHFCGHPVLSGTNHDLWFPLGEADDLFQAIERLMVTNHQAVNVTRVEKLAGLWWHRKNPGRNWMSEGVLPLRGTRLSWSANLMRHDSPN